MLGLLGAISSVIGIVGGILGIARALKTPKPPKIELPKIDLEAFNQAISKIQPISEQARQLLAQAIERYNRGELSPEMKAKLDSAFAELRDKTLSVLRARGVAEGSTIYQKALQQLQNWYNQQYALLLGQDLRNALQLVGLAKADIDTLLTKIGIGTKLGQVQMANWALQQQAGAMAGQALASGLVGLAGSLRDFANWYQQWRSGSWYQPKPFYSDDFNLWNYG